MRRNLRWLAPVLVIGLAAVLRFWALDRPGTLVFDELYYVRDAISQLTHGAPTVWPDDDPSMSGARATGFLETASNAVHPPLGKWFIGLGVLLFGPETGWGWRSAAAVAGVLTVAVVMRIGWRLTQNLSIAVLSGFLLAIDGVHITLSRVGLLDIFLTLCITVGALFVFEDGAAWRADRPLWRRPWLVAAAVAFGAAASVKWSGLYPLAAFLIVLTVSDYRARRRRGQPRAFLRTGAFAAVTAAIALPLTALVYLTTWTGWILSGAGWGRTAGGNWFTELMRYHSDMLAWHSTLSAPHPYQAHPLSWPLALRPTAMYETRWSDDGCPWTECVSAITSMPNPLVTWAGAGALLVLLWWAIRRGARLGTTDPLVVVAWFTLTGYLSGWLPWVLTFSRSAVFQFYAVALTPFAALALAVVIGVVCAYPVRGPHGTAVQLGSNVAPAAIAGRRRAALVFLGVAFALTLAFFPVWSGTPIPEWFWRAHLWLPGWD